MSVSQGREDPRAADFARRVDRMTKLTRYLWPGRLRARLLRDLTGSVLDVGAGTGANLPHLRSAGHVVAVEPDPAMRALLRTHVGSCPAPIAVVAAAAERLPFGGASFDVVVCTLVLCSVHDQARALAEARRVLKPGGRLVYAEHVRARGWWGRVQDRRDAGRGATRGGCHINRDTGAAIRAAGFRSLRETRIHPWLNSPLADPLILGVAVVDEAPGGPADLGAAAASVAEPVTPSR